MTERLQSHGMSKADAQLVTQTLANYEEIFVNQLLVEELGIQLPDDDDALLLAESFIMFLSFGSIGTVPLWVYVSCLFVDIPQDLLYSISCVVSLVAIALLGVVKSQYSLSSWAYSVAESLLVAGVSGALAYVVGVGLQQYLSSIERS